MQAPLSTIASGQHPSSGLSSASFPAPHPASPTSTSIAEGIGLAHDAGNLLGAIRLYCDLLALPGVLRNEHRHYAEELQRLTARSGSLIDRLLRPSGMGGAVEGTAGLCPADVVVECRGMLDRIAEPGALLIAVEAEAWGRVAVPREAFERILVNLIKNAAEARGAEDGDAGRGAVAVRVRSVAARMPDDVEGIAVSVEDRGRGMEKDAVRAALSGETASGAAGQRPGRGIGLRVVRELAAGTGGELRVQSRVGQGTTVEIVWAALPADGAESG